jgi:hypothetical protein
MAATRKKAELRSGAAHLPFRGRMREPTGNFTNARRSYVRPRST